MEVFYLFTFRALDPAFAPSGYLSDEAGPVFEAARTSCAADTAAAADRNRVTVGNAFKKNPDAARANAAPYRQYPYPKFVHPLFVGAGLADVSVFREGQYNFVMAACHAGSAVDMHNYPGMDHNGTMNPSLADSIPFVKKLLAGQQIDGNCASVKPPPSGN
jgi:hypothetical protein